MEWHLVKSGGEASLPILFGYQSHHFVANSLARNYFLHMCLNTWPPTVSRIFIRWRILLALLNKSWRQHPTKHQLYGHLTPITKTIQVRRTRHAGHCWRSRDELISDVLLLNPHKAEQKQDDQFEHTYSGYVRIRDIVLKTCQRQWTTGRSGERSLISVQAHDMMIMMMITSQLSSLFTYDIKVYPVGFWNSCKFWKFWNSCMFWNSCKCIVPLAYHYSVCPSDLELSLHVRIPSISHIDLFK